MFIGEFTHSIDLKGRVAMPFRFRRGLGKGAVVTRSIEPCLVVYPKQEWEEVAKKLTSLPMFDKKARAVSRFIFSGAIEVEFDRQGRALIPQYLREYAGLKKQVVMAGVYNKIEVWDPQAMAKHQTKAGIGTEEFNQELQDLGI